MTKPKLLVLDIETKPAKAYVWRAYDENVSPDQVVEPGGTICWAAKWVGEKEIFFAAEWDNGKQEMLEQIHALLSEADGVITYNGDRFDLPKLQGEFVLSGLMPPPPPTSIDVLKAVKKFGLFMNRLAYVGPLFEVGAKIKNEGFPLWKAVMDGEVLAQAKMRKYNVQDVVLLEKLYVRIKPFIRNHPHLGDTKSADCGSCGSSRTHSRGYRRTKAFRIQRLQCQECGAWSDGKREKMS